MKKFFEIVGLISIICFSFFITEKTTFVFENIDDLMIKIKDNYYKYNTDAIDAIIDGDSIVPGKYGKVVDIDKSYKNMKKYGYYNEKKYVYKKIKPNISLNDNMTKYIVSGNKYNRNVGIIFYMYDNIFIDDIVNILGKNNVKATFFVNSKVFEENYEYYLNLINSGYNIGNLSVDDKNFLWFDSMIKSLSNQKNGFCYFDGKEGCYDICIKYYNYIIKPLEIDNNLLFNVKNNLYNGSIFSFKNNKQLVNDLNSIIIFIKSKGYSIVNLEELLSEK